MKNIIHNNILSQIIEIQCNHDQVKHYYNIHFTCLLINKAALVIALVMTKLLHNIFEKIQNLNLA